MMPEDRDSLARLNRRRFLHGLTAVTVSVAGCGDAKSNNQEKQSDVESTSTDAREQTGAADEMGEVRNDLERIYSELGNHPIVVGEKIVFEPTPFENEFDHRELRKLADSVIERTDAGIEGVPGQRVEEIATAAELGKHLVNQWVAFHQVIAVGVTYQKALEQQEYGRASRVIQDGHTYVDGIETAGEWVEETLTEISPETLDIDELDVSSIRKTQNILIEIVRWTVPAYTGLEFVARGIDKYLEASDAQEGRQFEKSAEGYGEAATQFEAADEAFDEAQGTGKRLPHMSRPVDELRCVVPAFLTASHRLHESMREFEKGNEGRARKIGQEGMSLSDKKIQRCF